MSKEDVAEVVIVFSNQPGGARVSVKDVVDHVENLITDRRLLDGTALQISDSRITKVKLINSQP